MDFSTKDFVVFTIYAVVILAIGFFVSRQKKESVKVLKIIFWLASLFRGGL